MKYAHRQQGWLRPWPAPVTAHPEPAMLQICPDVLATPFLCVHQLWPRRLKCCLGLRNSLCWPSRQYKRCWPGTHAKFTESLKLCRLEVIDRVKLNYCSACVTSAWLGCLLQPPGRAPQSSPARPPAGPQLPEASPLHTCAAVSPQHASAAPQPFPASPPAGPQLPAASPLHASAAASPQRAFAAPQPLPASPSAGPQLPAASPPHASAAVFPPAAATLFI